MTAIPIFDGSLACDVASSSTWLTPSDPQIRCRSFVALKASHMTHPSGVWKALLYVALRGLPKIPTVVRPVLQNCQKARRGLIVCTTTVVFMCVGRFEIQDGYR